MRVHVLGLILLASAAVPAVAQTQPRRETVERRVDRLEQQLRAVQRRVFPNGNVPVEPEIGDEPAAVQPGGRPAATRSPASPSASTRSRRSCAH